MLKNVRGAQVNRFCEGSKASQRRHYFSWALKSTDGFENTEIGTGGDSEGKNRESQSAEVEIYRIVQRRTNRLVSSRAGGHEKRQQGRQDQEERMGHGSGFWMSASWWASECGCGVPFWKGF